MNDLEPKKLLIRWTSSGVSRGDLTLYLNEVTDSKVSQVHFVPKPNTAIVELDYPWGKSSYGSAEFSMTTL